MIRVAALALLLLVAACGGSASGAPDSTSDVSINPSDLPGDPDSQSPADADAVTPPPPDLKEKEETTFVGTGCGDGTCFGAENEDNCAKDCVKGPLTAAFVFAHKGDELAALGRLYDLAGAGATLYVFYVTFDETPIDSTYDGQTAKLSVATLGVPPENIYIYEKYIQWGLVTGNHEVLDRLAQHLQVTSPDVVYLPQLAGGDFEDELTHAVTYWAAHRALIFPKYYEVPMPSNYFVQADPDPALAQTDPDAFVDQFIKRWRLIPKDTEELKPTLGPEDVAQIRLAAAHIQNKWFQDFLYKLPEDRTLFLLREIQRFRQMPEKQNPTDKPYLDSMTNPEGTYLYNNQGYTYDEYKQVANVIESFYGTNVRSDPSALPFYDAPMELMIVHPFDVVLQVKSFSPEEDLLSFKVGYGPAKDDTTDCEPQPEATIPAMGQATITFKCNAAEPIGQHTYYFRAYSAKAKEFGDAALYTEVPVRVEIGQ